MRLPVMPPVSPMLAKAVKDIPTGDLSYEPKSVSYTHLTLPTIYSV